ncbi:MAG: UDP-glucose 6-dehydrogenase [Rickettsiaceae bacterium]|jgi:UDPglucose 6-dehydrogenase|nr:UDP-glucose 6-dehydrogenase [Rickettsiaceae bacterium]
MKICFIGSGYVGLVSGTVLASLGHLVTCIDKDQEKVRKLSFGESTIFEPGLEELLKNNLANGNLKFSADLNKELQVHDAMFIAVGTPSAQDGSADLSYVYAAIDDLSNHISDKQIIVIKSTVPPGTAKNIQKYIRQKGLKNEVVSNPEFLREGKAIEDFANPDRIVIGVSSDRSAQIMKEIYKPLLDKGAKMVVTDTTSSELIKYASNSFLALKIGFINEMANICEDIGGNIEDLAYGMGLDHRIGGKHLKAGPGFGGSCFPKDILAIAYLAKHLNEPCGIIEAVIASNDKRKHLMVEKIIRALRGGVGDRTIGGNLQDKTIAVLGLTFKADTDDVRSSPAVDIIKLLVERKANIKAYDPEGIENAKAILGGVEFAGSIQDAAKDADCILILTEWPEFAKFDYGTVSNILKSKLIIDLRNILDSKKVTSQGFRYICVGSGACN